jgi:hypothetical protein
VYSGDILGGEGEFYVVDDGPNYGNVYDGQFIGKQFNGAERDGGVRSTNRRFLFGVGVQLLMCCANQSLLFVSGRGTHRWKSGDVYKGYFLDG